MKKFSLKKKAVEGGKVEKKIGGFSLKGKNTTTQEKKIDRKLKVFDLEDDTNITPKNGITEITNIDDITESQKPKDAPLIIVPTKVNHLQEFLAKQAEREKKQVDAQEKKIAGEQNLGYGLITMDAIPSEKPANDNTQNILETADFSKIGGDDPTDESYNKVPVSKFGLAMLRGMGWSEELEKERRQKDKRESKKEKEVSRRRTPLAGLGAVLD